MLNYGVRIWPKACNRCGGDLRYERDVAWKRFVCWQCGRSPSPAARERIIPILDSVKKGQHQEGHPLSQ